ncbi:MAG: response regulator [Limnothrix sp. RL_2_0]|nr:response regulator [Limnothrix sp. RL_2_0]
MKNNIFPRTPSILIIDDEPDNFDVIEGFLFTEGYQLSYVSSANKALNRLTKHLPDLILLDAMMPEMDGFEFCSIFKKSSEWQHIPVIMVTALGTERLNDCLSVGADDFIAKPIKKVELKARVISMLRIKFQYDSLKKSLSFRDDLTNMIIHDFTNPLSSILLYTEYMQQYELSEKVATGINKIRRSATRLEGLTNDLLVYAKAEAGKLVLQYTDFELKDLLREVMIDFQALADVRHVTVQLVCPDLEPPPLRGDRSLLMRVLNNLLSNALKFSAFYSQITLELSVSTNKTGGSQLRLCVIDQGDGVPEELKDSIFQKYQIGQERDDILQTGLGLAFCKMVIEAHRGSIYVLDNEPKGSVFVIELPLINEAIAN